MRIVMILNAVLLVVNIGAGLFFFSLSRSTKLPEVKPANPIITCDEDDALEQSWVNMTATTPEAGDLANLFSLEQTLNEVIGVENSALEEWLIFEQIPAAAEATVKLETGDLRVPAAYVNLCFTLGPDNEWRCGVGRGVTPDKPAESQFAFGTTVTNSVPIKLEFQSAKEYNQLKSVHAASWPLTGEEPPATVTVNEAGVIQDPLPEGQTLLFAIFQDANGFRKHVWDLKVTK